MSWFVAPVSDAGPDAFVEALNAALKREPPAGTSADVAWLMHRMLHAHATGAGGPVPRCPAALLKPRLTTRVLLIDERVFSNSIGAVAARKNAQRRENGAS
ncbi:hypothetical protein [Paraburkholderia sp. RL17-337-BIB-A]|uniref:hypothetical protein n=1 Tax=Paraburkholderia sp. RL17-337-BIB-A TaxID=3031636 RepID=UPI0038BDD1FC